MIKPLREKSDLIFLQRKDDLAKFSKLYQTVINNKQLHDQESVFERGFGNFLMSDQHKITSSFLLERLSALIKAQNLEIMNIKPLTSNTIQSEKLIDQSFEINLVGDEKNWVPFIASLTHQPWPIRLTTLEINLDANKIILKASIDIYHY